MSKKLLAKNISSMSSAVFLSRITGLIRDQIFAYFFGITYVADAFNFAYTIPNLLRRLFGEGALSAAFLPLYEEVGVKKNKSEQIKFALNILSILTIFLTILCLLGIILAPVIIKLLTVTFPNLVTSIFGTEINFSSDFTDKTLNLTIHLTRILFPYLFFIGLSSTLISILNSHNYYFIPGLSSSFLNLGMVFTLGLLSFLFPTDLKGQIIYLSYGVLVGGLLQTLVNFPILKKIGYSFNFFINLQTKRISLLWQRFLPGVWGIAIRQVNLLTDRALASMLVAGSISALNYGNRIMQLPLGIFGVAIGTAVIPHFSRNVAQKNWQELSEKVRFAILAIFYILLPVTALLLGLGKEFIRVLFMRGAFDETALNMSYQALVFYSLGLLFYGLNRTFVSIFYAFKDTKTPVKIASLIVVFNIILNIIFMRYLQFRGLALATSVCGFIQFLGLMLFLKKFKQLNIENIYKEILKIIIIALFISVFLIILNHFIEPANFLSALTYLITVGIISVFLFVYLTYLLKSEISIELKKFIVKKLK